MRYKVNMQRNFDIRLDGKVVHIYELGDTRGQCSAKFEG